MASFFGMGRAPHQLSLRVTYEGYAKNPEDPDAPIPREGTLAVDWEAAEESSAVLERIDAQMRTLPFNHKGQVVALRLDVDDRADPRRTHPRRRTEDPRVTARTAPSARIRGRPAATCSRTSSELGGSRRFSSAAATTAKRPPRIQKKTRSFPRPHPRRETGR